jgi:hypothetical protein
MLNLLQKDLNLIYELQTNKTNQRQNCNLGRFQDAICVGWHTFGQAKQRTKRKTNSKFCQNIQL